MTRARNVHTGWHSNNKEEANPPLWEKTRQPKFPWSVQRGAKCEQPFPIPSQGTINAYYEVRLDHVYTSAINGQQKQISRKLSHLDLSKSYSEPY